MSTNVPVVRTVGAVIAGYVTVIILSIASAAILWMVFGAEGAFDEGTTVASTKWSIGELLLGFFAAVAAGCTAAAVGKHPANLPVKILASLFVVFGSLLAVLSMGAEPAPVPEGRTMSELTFVEAGQVASEPTWYTFVVPIVGFGGALLGGNLRRPSATG